MGKSSTRAVLGLAVVLLAGCTATQAAEVPGEQGADDGLERTISSQLERDPAVQEQFLAGLAVTGTFRCGVGVLDVERDGTHWLSVLCGDFADGSGMLRGRTDVAAVELDDDGSVASVRFPRRVPKDVRDAEVPVVPSQAELAGWD